MNYLKIGGIILVVLSILIFYFIVDIFEELIAGRPLSQVSISEIVFPLLLLIIGIILIIKNKFKNEKNP